MLYIDLTGSQLDKENRESAKIHPSGKHKVLNFLILIKDQGYCAICCKTKKEKLWLDRENIGNLKIKFEWGSLFN